MHEGISGADLHALTQEINRASTHFELCHALLDVIKSYSDLVREMTDSRAGKFSATQYSSSVAKVSSNQASPSVNKGMEKNQGISQSQMLPSLADPVHASQPNGSREMRNKTHRANSGGDSGGYNSNAAPSSGDILGQIHARQASGSGRKKQSYRPPATLSQEEAFAQIKGVDYSYSGRKRRQGRKNPNRPSGVRGTAAGRSPRTNNAERRKRNR